MSELHVLIVGAGVCGLAIAQGLKKAGIKYSIFEAEETARTREWGMSLHWGLPPLKECLTEDMAERLLKAVQCDPFHVYTDKSILPVFHSHTGERLKDIPVPGLTRVSRRKLRTFLSEGIDIQQGKRIADVAYTEGGVTVTFADGTTATGTNIIGTDGTKSKTRDLIFGAEKAAVTVVPHLLNNVAIQYETAEKNLFVRQLHPIFAFGLGPDNVFTWISVQDIPDPDKPETWKLQLITSFAGERDPENNTNETRLADFKAKAQNFAEPFKSAVLWLPEDTIVPNDVLSYWLPIQGDNHDGRIALAGDAAHPMTPHRGQGLNHALTDSQQFVDAMKSVASGSTTLASAVSAFEAVVIARSSEEVKLSYANTQMLHDWKRALESPLLTKSVSQLH